MIHKPTLKNCQQEKNDFFDDENYYKITECKYKTIQN